MASVKKIPSLRFPGFEGEWEIKKLGNISTIVGGGTPSKNEESYWNGNIPWISSSDIAEENVREINVKKYITKSGLNNSSTKKCPSGTILIVSRVGVGKVALSKQEVCTSQDFANITYISEDSLFSTYSLSILLKKESNRTQGTSIKGITTDEIKGFKLLFPPLPEQQKIADCLTAMDDTIEVQQQKVEQLQSYKKGLLQQLFSQTLRFPGFEGAWEEKKLGEVGESIIGLTYSADDVSPEGILVLRSSNIKDSKLSYSDNVYVKKDIPQKLITKEGDVLICTNNGSKNLIGKSALIDAEGEGYSFGGFMTIFRSENGKFVFQLLQTELFRKEIYKNLGSIINRISIEDLNNMKFNFPSFPEQQKIADSLSTLDDVIELETQKLEQLRQYKKGLLQQLFV